MRERRGYSGLTPTHWAVKKPLYVRRYRESNPIHPSPLADDIATAPSEPVYLYYQQGLFYMHHPIDRLARPLLHWLEREMSQSSMKDRPVAP